MQKMTSDDDDDDTDHCSTYTAHKKAISILLINEFYTHKKLTINHMSYLQTFRKEYILETRSHFEMKAQSQV